MSHQTVSLGPQIFKNFSKVPSPWTPTPEWRPETMSIPHHRCVASNAYAVTHI